MSVNIVPLLEEVLGLLQTINETRGVPEGENISDKNVLQTGNSNPNKKVKSSLSNEEQKKTKEVASIFAKTFFEMQRKFQGDKALKTSVQKIIPNAKKLETGGRKSDLEMPKKGSMLGGILMLLGGAGALIMGLLTDGPFKGALKILSKIGISGGIKMLMTAAKGMLGTFSKFVTAPFKFAGKLLGKGFMGKIFNVLKPLGKIFKRIPIIGTFISIGFAISRFNKGQNVRGVIDVLSGLVGLIDLVAPGVGFALSFGLDMLNVWMDSKMADPKNAGKSEMDILGEIGKTIGNWIWKNALWLPVIGGFKRWGMAYDAFKGGNIVEGLKQFGLGILSFAGMGPIIMGIETLMGFFGDKEEKKDLKPSTSWFGRIKEWVKNKLKKLPSFLKKPLQWFGIIDDSSESEPNMESSKKIDYEQKIVGWLSGLWGKITPMLENIGKWFSGLWEKISTWASGLWEKMTPFFEVIAKWFSDIWGKVKEFLGSDFMNGIIDSVKNIASSVMSIVDTIFRTIKSIVEAAKATIGGFSKMFGGGYTEEAKANAKKMGWNSVEEYEKSGWKENPDKKKVGVIDEKRKKHVDDLVLIGREQIAILSDIRNIGMQTYKVLAGSSGGGSASPIIIPNSGGGSKSKPSSQVSLNTSRGDYGSSPYAFA